MMKTILNIIVILILIMIARIDSKTMEIPDGLNLSLGICGILAIWLCPEVTLTERLIGAVCVSVPIYLVCMLVPDAFGGGDIKLLSAMGFYLGWKLVLLGTFLASLIGGVQAIYLLTSGKVKAGEGAHMAFGPALCMGLIISMVVGNELLTWYFGLFY